MEDSINLYFDFLDEDNSRGVTEDSKKIYYNLGKIDADRVEKFNEFLADQNSAEIFIPTGRYMTAINASLDRAKIIMATFDLFDNKEFALSKAPTNPLAHEIFMSCFWVIHDNYKADYKKFVLVKGIPPEK